jgi:hypothetical protein
VEDFQGGTADLRVCEEKEKGKRKKEKGKR